VTRIEAVVWDMDGVLVDSEERWDRARKDLVAETGGTWKDGATHAMLGMSSPEWSAYVRDELGVPLEPAEISSRVVALLLEGYADGLPLIPGAVEAVRRVAGFGRPLGLASSSNREVIDLVLRESALADLFSATVSSEEVPRGKPSPDVYLEAPAAARDRARARHRDRGLLERPARRRGGGLRVVAIPHAAFPPAPDALALADVVLGGLDELDEAAVLGLVTPAPFDIGSRW
jgi:beta-phosphoglucomutase-like phosphatase (HAD superfamily)